MSYQDEIEYSPQKEETDFATSRRQERRDRRAQRRTDRQASGLGWAVGLLLILIGVIFLLFNTEVLPNYDNWWALFLLLPGFGTLSAAIGAYRRNGGQFNPEVIIPLLTGFLFLGMTAVFLFNLDYGWLWPLFLITGGLLLLAGPLLNRHQETQVPK
jgi:O-antigen/teichoic acid export membrane protein